MLVLRVTILKHVGENIVAGWCWVNVYNENIYHCCMLIMNLSSGWPEGRAGDGEEDEEEE